MDFYKEIKKSTEVQRLAKKIRSGMGTLEDATKLADAVGVAVADGILADLSDEPSAEEIREALAVPLMQSHDYVGKLVSMVIDKQYRDIGVGLRAKIPDMKTRRNEEMFEKIMEVVANVSSSTAGSAE